MPNKSNPLSFLDLVVLLLCLGAVIALLFPGIRGPVDNRRRTHCAARVRFLAQAANIYESTKGHYPGYCNDFGTFQRGTDPTNPRRVKPVRTHRKIGTWVVSLLPYIDEQAIYETWTEDRYPIAFSEPNEYGVSNGIGGKGFSGPAISRIQGLVCPSDERDYPSSNSYAANTGMHPMTVIADFAQSMAVPNGVFNNKFPGLDTKGRVVPVGNPVSSYDLKDGLSSTLLFSENVNALPWHRAGRIDAIDLVKKDGQAEIRYPITSRYAQGLVWHYEDDQNTLGANNVKAIHRINGVPAGLKTSAKDLIATQANAFDLARPSSNHDHGANASLADGATRFITESIDYRVYQAMLTPHGQASNVPDVNFVEGMLKQ